MPLSYTEMIHAKPSPRKIAEIQATFGYTNRTKFRRRYLEPLLNEGFLEMTIPEKPCSSHQSYRLTEKGETYLQTLPLDEPS
jgi:ATP-dependent DNA helicase RecG